MNIKNSFILRSKIWRWPGDGGWHFITLDKNISEKLRAKYPRGFIKIRATLGKTFWDTSLFPHMKNKKLKQVEYLVCINKKVLKKEYLFSGDEVKIKVELK